MKTLITLLLFSALPAFAGEEVKVYWDCNLSGDQVSCIDLKQAYFENPDLEDASTPATADLKLIIRVLPLTNETEYIVTAQWKQGTLLKYPGFRLNSNLGAAVLLKRVDSFLKEVTKPYLSIVNNESGTAPEEDDKPYYINPVLAGNASKQQGLTTIEGSLETTWNYSTPKWRLYGDLGYGRAFSDAVKTSLTPSVTTGITDYAGRAVAVRSLGAKGAGRTGHWDVALFVSDRGVRNTLKTDGDTDGMPAEYFDNASRKTAVKGGVEWIAVPFLTDTSNGNVALRYSLTAEHHKYLDPISYQYIQETFARHSFNVYLKRNFSKIDVAFTASAFTSSFRKRQLSGVTGDLELTYKIHPRLTLGALGSMQYATNKVLSTAEDGPKFLDLTSANIPLTYTGTLSLSYTLGSIRIFNKEQRWK